MQTPRSTPHYPAPSPLAMRLAILFAGVVFALAPIASGQSSVPPRLKVSTVGGKSTLSVAGVTIRQSAAAITNQKLVVVPDSACTIITWSEQSTITSPSNTSKTIAPSQAFYSMSFDGETFTEPRPADDQIKLHAFRFDPLQTVPAVPDVLTMEKADNRKQKTETGKAGRQEGRKAERQEGRKAEGQCLDAPMPQDPQDASPNAQLYIVQFIAPPSDALTSSVRSLGGKVRDFLAEHAQIVEMTAQTRDQVAALPHVRWVGPFEPAYRLESPLAAELAANPQQMPTRRYSIMLFERGPAAQQAVAARIAAMGGIVNVKIEAGFRIEATLTGAQLLELVRLNEVEFVARWGPPGVDMDIARQIGGATPLLANLGFHGEGVRGEVMDDGLLISHQAFADPSPLIQGTPPMIMSHGTSTYGIIFGNGAANPAGTGLLPNREQGIFAKYQQLAGQGGLESRYSLTADLVNPLGPYRAVFQSNSWGSTPTTDYLPVSSELDDILFQYDLFICQSQSNNGNQFSRPEAWAKNATSIGGVVHRDTLSRSDDSWSTGTGVLSASFGPAADGRVKPDLAHFYDNVQCPTSGSDTAYTFGFNGTSAATPITCGYAGLLFQMWHEKVFSGFGGAATVFESRPHMATVKALLVNSAYRYNWLAGGSNADLTRNKQGWGMVDLARLYNDRNKIFIINQSDAVLPGGSRSYQLQVAAGEPELRATMVYRDPKGNPASGVARINDLSLKVTAPGGTFYWGNNGLNDSNYSTPGGFSNTIDTVENVFIQNPAAGIWTVTVYGDAIVQDGRPETPEMDADFALVVAGVVVHQPCPADLNLDHAVNVSDLLAVINAWGSCPGACPPSCAADINHDCAVNVSDLLTVINGWGPCP